MLRRGRDADLYVARVRVRAYFPRTNVLQSTAAAAAAAGVLADRHTPSH